MSPGAAAHPAQQRVGVAQFHLLKNKEKKNIISYIKFLFYAPK